MIWYYFNGHLLMALNFSTFRAVFRVSDFSKIWICWLLRPKSIEHVLNSLCAKNNSVNNSLVYQPKNGKCPKTVEKWFKQTRWTVIHWSPYHLRNCFRSILDTFCFIECFGYANAIQMSCQLWWATIIPTFQHSIFYFLAFTPFCWFICYLLPLLLLLHLPIANHNSQI